MCGAWRERPQAEVNTGALFNTNERSETGVANNYLLEKKGGRGGRKRQPVVRVWSVCFAVKVLRK